MQRVMIIGGPGDGKTTLALRLAEVLCLPVLHMDRFYWSAGWKERSAQEVQELARRAIAAESWILEGNHAVSWDARAQRADLIVYLDMPRWLRIMRIVKRTMYYLGRSRPDIGPDCPERFNFDFLKWAWNFDEVDRDKHLDFLRRWQGERRIVHLKSTRDVRNFLQTPCQETWDIPTIPGLAWT